MYPVHHAYRKVKETHVASLPDVPCRLFVLNVHSYMVDSQIVLLQLDEEPRI